MALLLLTAGSYVLDELAAEFGRVPPTFLPVGNRRLYAVQAEHLRESCDRLVMSLPESFEVGEHDQRVLRSLGIEAVPVVEGLSLGESIVHAVNLLGIEDTPLRILHGDTLMTGRLPETSDVVSVHHTPTAYDWAVCELDPNGGLHVRSSKADDAGLPVLSGYFSFSSSTALVQALTWARGDFLEGLNHYARIRPLRPVPLEGEWLDFGHLQTYFHSRWYLTSQRAFNGLEQDRRVVTKFSDRRGKIEAEAAWFRELPPELKIFTPRYLGSTVCGGKPGYRLEHEHLCTLSDLFVFGRLGDATWGRIFEACREFLETEASFAVGAAIQQRARKLYGPKARARITELCSATGIDPARGWSVNGRPVPPLLEIVEELDGLIGDWTRCVPGVMHGDFCFSNIFYDFRSESIRVIDPRGHLDDPSPCLYGDVRYDVAKLAHSVQGRYDFIVAGLYECRMDSPYRLSLDLPDDERTARIAAVFGEQRLIGHSPRDESILAATSLLFLSMLPLHFDDPQRQQALLARGLELYAELEGGRRDRHSDGRGITPVLRGGLQPAEVHAGSWG